MPNPGDEVRAWAARRLDAAVEILAAALGDHPFFAGADFGVVDAYEYWALSTYRRLLRAPLSAALTQYMERVGQRPSVQAAVAQHG